jgi:long-subunit fatty acid transport protein
MKKVMTAGAALLLTTSIASAGGLDRSGQPIGFIFEDGEAAFVSFGLVNPTVSSNPESDAGNVAQNYTALSFGYKRAVSDDLELAIIYDQPYGASVEYNEGDLAGLFATLNSGSITGILTYAATDNISIYGGLRGQSLQGEIAVPLAAYTYESDTSYAFGYLVGAAYEMPEIALRVALTYNSAIKHTLEGTEGSPTAPGTSADTEFDVQFPQSLNLDFQTGVAADTLVFGSVRWAEWSVTDVTPLYYIPGSLVDYEEDVFTYSLGVGRRFSDQLSGSFSVSYEEATGEDAPNLGPTDGFISYSVGMEYAMNDSTKIRGGIRYIDIGDATSDYGFSFEDNSAIAVGASLVYTY